MGFPQFRAKRSVPILGVTALLALAGTGGCADKRPAPPNAAQQPDAPTQEELAAVVVEVDGEKLTEQMAQKQAQEQLRAMTGGRQVQPQMLQAMMPQVRQRVEQQFIMGVLLKNQAARENVVADPAEVDKTIDTMKSRLPKGLDFGEALKREGMTEAELRQKVSDDLSIRQLLTKTLPQDVSVSDEEIAAHYEANKDKMQTPESIHARHILLKVDEGADDKAKAEKKAKADDLQKLLAAGADFAKTAKENSDCPSAKTGGDLGTFPRGRMVPAFEKAAFAQKVNEIGPVVETKFGYHIVQVLERQEAKTKELDEAKGEITNQLKQQKQAASFEQYIDGLKAKAKITRPADPAPEKE